MKNFESFESNRWIWRVNFWLQVGLVAALAVVVNVIAMSVWMRVDLTRHRVASLSGEALTYVRDLDRRTGDAEGSEPEPVKIIVTLTEDTEDPELDQVYRDVRALLREFEYASRDNERTKIQVEYLNVFQNRTRAEILGLADLPNIVVFKYRDFQRVVTRSDLYVVQRQQRSQFVGERAFVSALLEVTSAQRPVLYFLTGHGELRISDIDASRGASQLDSWLRMRAYDTKELDLGETRRIPDDAGVVLVLAPQTSLLRLEQETLRDYLTRRAGKVIIALTPGHVHGLDDLFYEWGILADDVFAVETSPRHRMETGDLRVTEFTADHPITRSLVDNTIPVLIGAARSVRPDPGRAPDDALIVNGLLRTSDLPTRTTPSSWGEADYRQQPPVYNANRDLAGPIMLGSVAERRVQPGLGVNVQGGRLVVFGSGDFVTNHRIGELGNFTLILNAVNWALNPEQHVDIPSRPIERLKLNLSQQQLRISGFAIVLGPALAVTFLGLIVYFARRR